MSPSSVSPPSAGLRFSGRLVVFLLLVAIAIFFQWEEGAYRSEFGGHPDEAAHYVTGLFVRDAVVFVKEYAFSGFRGAPVKTVKDFVQSYYDHYPKIGLGVWPPFYYMVQTGWTLPFGVSRTSVLLLMASISALVGTVLYSALQEEFGPGLALSGSLLWLGLPLAQQYGGMMMAEMLSALTMFAATLRFGRYVDERKPGDAVWFGLLAACAILTKGTGLALAFVPPFSILATRRFSLLKERGLWIGGGIVLILAGPWTFATRKLGEGGWEQPHVSLGFTIHALPYYGWKLGVASGVLLTSLAVWGLVCRIRSAFQEGRDGTLCRPGMPAGKGTEAQENKTARSAVPTVGADSTECRPYRGSDVPATQGKWCSCFALIVGVVVFQSIAPVGREARHLIPALPALLMFAVAGMGWIRQRVAALTGYNVASGLICAAGLLAFYGTPIRGVGSSGGYGSIGESIRFSPFRIYNKDSRGFGPVAERLMSLDATGASGAFLVSSDATGEGMFIAEVAMREMHRPTHFAKRASKELASSAWGGGGYKAKYDSDAALLGWLTSGAVGFVVVDTAIPERNRRPHHLLLQRVINTHPERFKRIASEPLFRGGEAMHGAVQAYRVLRGAIKSDGSLGKRRKVENEGYAEGFGVRRFSAAFTAGQFRE